MTMKSNEGHKNVNYHRLFIFSLHHDSSFSQSVADILEDKMQDDYPGDTVTKLVTHGRTNHQVFADGDFKTHQTHSVADADVYIIARCRKGEEYRSKDILETMQLAFSLKQGRANKVTVILPQMPYARQDKAKEDREVILLPWIVNLFKTSGVDRIVTFEIHNKSTVGNDPWFIENIQTQDFLKKHIRNEFKLNWKETKFVAPDTNAANYVKEFADYFGSDIVIINKKRDSNGKSEALQIVGDIAGYNAVIVDDIFDSCGTISDASQKMIEMGVKDIYVAGTHFVLTRKWRDNLRRIPFKKIIATDTCIIPETLQSVVNTKILHICKMVAGVVHNLHNGKSVTEFTRGTETIA